MDIVTLPVTGNNQDIQENFLQELSQRVKIKGNAVDKKIQILIFKPAGRPQEEFDNIIQVFKETGRRLDKNLIFITATKPDRCKFEIPANFNFALQTSVFVNDENKIDPMSSDAMDKVADHLTRKCGMQPSKHDIRSHGAVLGAAATETNVEGQIREINALKQENERLKQYVQEGHGHQQEIENLKKEGEEQRREINTLKQENERLKQYVKKEGHEHQQEIEHLKKSVEDQGREIIALKQENRRLDAEKKGQEGFGHQGKRKDLKRSGLKEQDLGGRMPEIQFKHREKSYFFLGREVIYSVNVHDVENEKRKIEEGHYDFQRKYEEKFFLKPGTLLRVLECIKDELKNISGDNLVMEGDRFQNLTGEIDKTFGLSSDNLREFLSLIKKRNGDGK